MGPVLGCCFAQMGEVMSRSLGVKLPGWNVQEASGWPHAGLKCTEPSSPACVDAFVSACACAPPSGTPFFSGDFYT